MATYSPNVSEKGSSSLNDDAEVINLRPFLDTFIRWWREIVLLTIIAAAIVGFLAFKKSGKSIGEFSGDLATSVKETASETSTMVKDGIADAGAKAKERVSKLRDGVDDEKSQAEIAEEALTLKETGKSSNVPTDPVIEQQSKVGAISY